MSAKSPSAPPGNTGPPARYSIPCGEAHGELEAKKSVFVATVAAASDEDCALAVVESARRAVPRAAHHAWAYRLRPEPHARSASSDDGEPGGTAGRPMLAVLEGSGLYEVVAVCSRIYGGIKLGTGGLVRAYAGAVREALSALTTTECVLYRRARVAVDYGLYAMLLHQLPRHEVLLDEPSFGAQVTVQMAVPPERAAVVTSLVADISKGQVTLDANWAGIQYYIRSGQRWVPREGVRR